jgi:hypothetical protein
MRHDEVTGFLSQYDDQIFKNALILREVLFANLPGIIRTTTGHKELCYWYNQSIQLLQCSSAFVPTWQQANT